MVQEWTRDPPYSKVCHLLFLHALFYNYIQEHAHMKPSVNTNLFKNPSFIVFFGLLITGDAETHLLHMLYTHTHTQVIHQHFIPGKRTTFLKH